MSSAKEFSEEMHSEQLDADLALCLSLQEEDQLNDFAEARAAQHVPNTIEYDAFDDSDNVIIVDSDEEEEVHHHHHHTHSNQETTDDEELARRLQSQYDTEHFYRSNHGARQPTRHSSVDSLFGHRNRGAAFTFLPDHTFSAMLGASGRGGRSNVRININGNNMQVLAGLLDGADYEGPETGSEDSIADMDDSHEEESSQGDADMDESSESAADRDGDDYDDDDEEEDDLEDEEEQQYTPDHSDSDNDNYEDNLELAERLGEVRPRGLNASEINTLPTSKFTTKPSSASGSSNGATNGGEGDLADKECHVCLSAFCANETIRTLPCLHRFHQACIDQWITLNAVCPVCRVKIRDEIRRH